MGAAASVPNIESIKKEIEKLPESFNAEKAKEVLGSNFDQSIFDQLVANQLVQKSDLVAYYDNRDKSATTEPAPAAAAAAAVDAAAPATKADTNASAASKPQVQYAPDETTVDFKTLHSLVRWNKPEKMDELQKLLKTDAGAVHVRDPKNGNYPLHIAAQNEFKGLCELLLKAKHDPNKQNAGGQTALHMATSYCSAHFPDFLKANGADPNIKNEIGIPAGLGLEGVAMINASENAKQLDGVFEEIKKYYGKGIEAGKFVKAVLDKKKALKKSGDNWWNDDLDAKFKSVMRS